MHASDRRTQLLQIALNVFSQKGFNGTTTKEIAAAAGVTEAVIFRHFPTKQALYQAVLESGIGCAQFETWMEQVKDCMARNDDEALIRTIASAIIASYREDPRLERVLLFAALEGNEQALEHHRTFALPIFELFRDYIVRRQREGALANYDPGAILGSITGPAQRFAVLTQLFGFRIDKSDAEVIDTFTQILMNGIQAR